MNCKKELVFSIIAILILFNFVVTVRAQKQKKPSYWKNDWNKLPTKRRNSNGGTGPYKLLVIKGATVIDGTGAPPDGPMDIVIRNNKIVSYHRTKTGENYEKATKVINANGMFVTPGFVDVHAHSGHNPTFTYKLWLAHGETTVRGVPFGDLEWSLKQRELSKNNKIVAPHLVVCARAGSGDKWNNKKIKTPEDAREWVRYVKKKGADCIGESISMDPPLAKAMLSEADSLGIPTMAHLAQMGVPRLTARKAVKFGLDGVTHYYGIFESILNKHSIQDWPVNYNYANEDNRFAHVPDLKEQSFQPESKEWEGLIKFFLKHNTFLSPTFYTYSTQRNMMAGRDAIWNKQYVLGYQWKRWEPNPTIHGSQFWHWTSIDEAKWHQFFNKFMKFIYDYNKSGGRVTLGTDVGYGYMQRGFGYIREMEMMEEAGLTPFEVLRSATYYGAQEISRPRDKKGSPISFGIIRPGKRADLLIMTRNPAEDFKLLYGTGTMRFVSKLGNNTVVNPNISNGKVEWVRSLKYTIKDGIIYDVDKLLTDLRNIVKKDKRRNDVQVKFAPDKVQLLKVSSKNKY
jgi:imidazolonepropionase-like amidohydrolase